MKSITFKLDDGAFLPKKGTSLSAGYDIHALKEVQVEPNSRKLIETGVYLRDMPSDLYIRIAPRSGLAVKKSIDIGAGVVDSDYRGEIRVLFINNGSEPYHINCHDRIAQLIFEKFEPLTHLIGMTNENETVEEEHDPDLERGEGGFGSTGV